MLLVLLSDNAKSMFALQIYCLFRCMLVKKSSIAYEFWFCYGFSSLVLYVYTQNKEVLLFYVCVVYLVCVSGKGKYFSCLHLVVLPFTNTGMAPKKAIITVNTTIKVVSASCATSKNGQTCPEGQAWLKHVQQPNRAMFELKKMVFFGLFLVFAKMNPKGKQGLVRVVLHDVGTCRIATTEKSFLGSGGFIGDANPQDSAFGSRGVSSKRSPP